MRANVLDKAGKIQRTTSRITPNFLLVWTPKSGIWSSPIPVTAKKSKNLTLYYEGNTIQIEKEGIHPF
jgi:hypothetical protein